MLLESPELFPPAMAEGFVLDGLLRESSKLPGVRLRKLKLNDGSIYTLRPSFVMPSMMGTVDDLEAPLLLLSLGVPCWALTKIFGHHDMYWYRLLERLGRNSLVGTTVRDPERLPQDIVADEHHVDWCGEKCYIATTAGAGCILGVALTKSADETLRPVPTTRALRVAAPHPTAEARTTRLGNQTAGAETCHIVRRSDTNLQLNVEGISHDAAF